MQNGAEYQGRLYKVPLRDKQAVLISSPFTVGEMGLAMASKHFDTQRASNSAHPIESRMRANLQRGIVDSQLDDSGFLPIDVIEDVLNDDDVIKLLDACPNLNPPTSRSPSIQHVRKPGSNKSRKRILGILVLMKRIDYFKLFVENSLWDGDFLSSPKGNGSCSSIFHGWDINDTSLFRSYWRYFFVPFFDFKPNKAPSYNLNGETTLPWMEYGEARKGGSCVVRRVRIHKSHHNFPEHKVSLLLFLMNDANIRKVPTTPRYFALKEMNPSAKKAFNKELDTLHRNLDQNPDEKHLIKLLFSFQHGEKSVLVFEWAENSLDTMWDEPNANLWVRNHLKDTWMAKQFHGLASALRQIHGRISGTDGDPNSDSLQERACGRHGDIKASNILWFTRIGEERNHLVLSDLGLTSYHHRGTRSNVRWSRIGGHTRTYRPPEVDLDGRVSPAYDIWSLGCVFLQFCIWYIGGQKALDQFRTDLEEESKTGILNFGEDNFFRIQQSSDGSLQGVKKPAVEKVGPHPI